MDIEYLTEEHITQIHEQVILNFGGDNGYYDHKLVSIKSILAQQFDYFGYDKYPSIFEKAAMLMYFFTKGHCFVDGNKRVGISTASVFLMINGYQDNLDDSYGYNKTMEISKLNLTGDILDNYIKINLAQWLATMFMKNLNS